MSKVTLYLIGATEQEVYKAHGFCQESGFKLQCYSKEAWKKLAPMAEDKEGSTEEPQLIPGQVRSVPYTSSNKKVPFASESQYEENHFFKSNDRLSSDSGNVIPFRREELLTGEGYQQSAPGHIQPFADMEKEAIIQAMNTLNGNLTEIAKALGVGRATLYRKIKTYQIDIHASRQQKKKAA